MKRNSGLSGRSKRKKAWRRLRGDMRSIREAPAVGEGVFLRESLQLISCIDYVTLLLENVRVSKYLAKYYPDLLNELRSAAAENACGSEYTRRKKGRTVP